jgi:FkbM family methyltransferase
MALTVLEAEYHLFEPLAEAVPMYRRDLQERLRRRLNFHLYPVALSDHSGTVDIFVTHDGWGSSMLDRGDIPEVEKHVTVPLYTLDEFIEANRLAKPDVIKLDVQGAERLILAGGQRALQSTRVVFMETWLTRGYGPQTPLLTEMIEFMEAAGFTLVDFGELFRDERGRVYSVDVVFFSNLFLAEYKIDYP